MNVYYIMFNKSFQIWLNYCTGTSRQVHARGDAHRWQHGGANAHRWARRGWSMQTGQQWDKRGVRSGKYVILSAWSSVFLVLSVRVHVCACMSAWLIMCFCLFSGRVREKDNVRSFILLYTRYQQRSASGYQRTHEGASTCKWARTHTWCASSDSPCSKRAISLLFNATRCCATLCASLFCKYCHTTCAVDKQRNRCCSESAWHITAAFGTTNLLTCAMVSVCTHRKNTAHAFVYFGSGRWWCAQQAGETNRAVGAHSRSIIHKRIELFAAKMKYINVF